MVRLTFDSSTQINRQNSFTLCTGHVTFIRKNRQNTNLFFDRFFFHKCLWKTEKVALFSISLPQDKMLISYLPCWFFCLVLSHCRIKNHLTRKTNEFKLHNTTNVTDETDVKTEPQTATEWEVINETIFLNSTLESRNETTQNKRNKW